MINPILIYLLESSLCLVFFAGAFRILLSNRTNFTWMRSYLLASLALSVVLPLITIPIEWSEKLIPTDEFPGRFLMSTKPGALALNAVPNRIQADPGITIPSMILLIAFLAYLAGASYKTFLFVRNLNKINRLIKKSTKVKGENYWIVCLKSEIPAFSFFNYIFINTTYKNLSAHDQLLIKHHELVHVKQYHTLDILFIELVGILCWFNPIVNYLKRSLKEIHEYIADEKIAGRAEKRKAYAELLLSLASANKVVDLATSFTGEYIKRRIMMIAKPRTSPKYNLMFLVLIPLASMLLLSFSYLKPHGANSKIEHGVTAIQLDLKKYCGVYFPSKRDLNSGLKPVEITLKGNNLFIGEVADPAGTIELQVESDSIFSYSQDRGRTIAFELNGKKEVTGCALLNTETRGAVDYLVLKGEYLKLKPGKSEQ